MSGPRRRPRALRLSTAHRCERGRERGGRKGVVSQEQHRGIIIAGTGDIIKTTILHAFIIIIVKRVLQRNFEQWSLMIAMTRLRKGKHPRP